MRRLAIASSFAAVILIVATVAAIFVVQDPDIINQVRLALKI